MNPSKSGEYSAPPEDATGDNTQKKKKRKLHTYEKAKLAYETVKADKERRKQAKLQRDQERQEALAISKRLKQEKMKLLTRRTKKGQPKLDQQVEFLLKKIEKSVAPKTDGKPKR